MSEIKTLTVGELIDKLSQFDRDTPTVAMVNYGDRCRTMQAIPFGDLDLVDIEESQYSDSGFKVVEQDLGDDEVLVLNYDATDLN